MEPTNPANNTSGEPDTPLFLSAARQLSTALGVSPDRLLSDPAPSDPLYPTLECLQADEVADYQAGRPIGTDRMDHADSCQYCHPLLEVSAPGRSFRDAFLAEIANAEAPEPAAPSARLPELEPRIIRWPVGAFAAAAAILLASNIVTLNRVGELSQQIAADRSQHPFVDQDAISKAVSLQLQESLTAQRADRQELLGAVDKHIDSRLSRQNGTVDSGVIAAMVAKELQPKIESAVRVAAAESRLSSLPRTRQAGYEHMIVLPTGLNSANPTMERGFAIPTYTFANDGDILNTGPDDVQPKSAQTSSPPVKNGASDPAAKTGMKAAASKP